MKRLALFFALSSFVWITSCSETTQQDNTTHTPDTMVIKQNKTDTATTTIGTDTTKR